MGTHISKVKSVDLDVWTPEQMAVRAYLNFLDACINRISPKSVQKWGNERANLYWEAHLKAGHQPPDQYVFC